MRYATPLPITMRVRKEVEGDREYREPDEVPRVAPEKDQPGDRAEHDHDERHDRLPVPQSFAVLLHPIGELPAPALLTVAGRGIERLLPLRMRIEGEVLGRGHGGERAREHEVHRAEREQHEQKQLPKPTGNDQGDQKLRSNSPPWGDPDRQCHQYTGKRVKNSVTHATSTVTSGASRPAAPNAIDG